MPEHGLRDTSPLGAAARHLYQHRSLVSMRSLRCHRRRPIQRRPGRRERRDIAGKVNLLRERHSLDDPHQGVPALFHGGRCEGAEPGACVARRGVDSSAERVLTRASSLSGSVRNAGGKTRMRCSTAVHAASSRWRSKAATQMPWWPRTGRSTALAAPARSSSGPADARKPERHAPPFPACIACDGRNRLRHPRPRYSRRRTPWASRPIRLHDTGSQSRR